MCMSVVRLHVPINLAHGCMYLRSYIMSRVRSWPLFASRSLEQNQATKCHGVPKDLQRGDLSPEQKHGAGDQQDVLEDAELLGVDARGDPLI
jgi:hypothetical protein